MVAAILLALWSVPALTALAPETVPRLDSVTLRAPALMGFSIGLGLISVLACGVVPLLIARPRARGILAGRPETMSRAATLGARSSLVVVQTAIAVVLLTAATLTVRSFQGIQQVQLGFDPDRLVTFDVLAPSAKYEDRVANERFYRPALERVRGLPGVSGAAAIHLRPFEFGPIGSGAAIILDGQSPRDREAWRKHPSLNAEAISPDYFKVMGIPVLQGRAFTEQDSDGSPRVVIVSLSAARRLWPGENPIGKRLMASYDQPPGHWQSVIGVAGDVKYRGLTEGTLDLYKPYRQSEDAVKHFIVKTSQDASLLMERLRSEIGAMEPQAAVDAIRPMRDVVDRQVGPWRFAALLFSLLAALALVVAVVGLYALLAHQVEDRGREIGIRMALGATPLQIFRMFGARALRLLAAGLLAGVVTAVLGAHSMKALLFGVTPVDASSHALAGILLLIAAGAGAVRPLRRATAIDPIVALRQD
jgi:predicted permease